MLIDSFMGSKTAKITLSIALGVMFSHLLPDSIWEWVRGTGSWRQISKAITVLLGFPIVILLERIYEFRRTRHVLSLLGESEVIKAKNLLMALAEKNPDFYAKLFERLQQEGYVPSKRETA